MSENPKNWKSKCEHCGSKDEMHTLPNIAIFLNPTNDLFPGTKPRKPINEYKEAYYGAYKTVITIDNRRTTIQNDNRVQ